MKKSLIIENYKIAKERYLDFNINVDKATEMLLNIPISIQCWQADDVNGFEQNPSLGGGGIQATGNYPGRARNIGELKSDIEKVISLVPGKHRLSLHAIYGDFGTQFVDRDAIEPKHFDSWIEWSKKTGVELDFNSTSFGHPKSQNLTLANPDKNIREFWKDHTKRCRKIADYIGAHQKTPCMLNIWIHDGSKDTTVDRYRYRKLLENSLDDIFSIDLPNMKDCIEAKLFGIGLESYTVGSYDFYLGYGAKKQKIVTLDTGHFHLTESIPDKISSLLLFTPEIMLHVSRPIRWDSDHVVILNDDLTDLTKEIIRSGALSRTHIGLDFFDASINRIGAYVIGIRSTQKALLQALLEPIEQLRQYEQNGQYFERLALLEEAKTLPWNAVWDHFLLQNNLPVAEDCITEIQHYEQGVTSKRK